MLQNIVHAVPPKRSNQFGNALLIMHAQAASNIHSNFLTERNPDWKTDSLTGAEMGVCFAFCSAIFFVGAGTSVIASTTFVLLLRFFGCSSSLLTTSTVVFVGLPGGTFLG
jgi:hypothetical protein